VVVHCFHIPTCILSVLPVPVFARGLSGCVCLFYFCVFSHSPITLMLIHYLLLSVFCIPVLIVMCCFYLLPSMANKLLLLPAALILFSSACQTTTYPMCRSGRLPSQVGGRTHLPATLPTAFCRILEETAYLFYMCHAAGAFSAVFIFCSFMCCLTILRCSYGCILVGRCHLDTLLLPMPSTSPQHYFYLYLVLYACLYAVPLPWR
jgi:hypothetical protein